MQCGLNLRFWRGVQMLNLCLAGEAPTQRLHGQFAHVQITFR